jgi:putative ABC transport system permease protein
MRIVREVLKGIAAAPGKSLLTIFTVGAGVGVLILALSLSFFFSELVEKQLSPGGTIITFANGERNAEGEVEPVRPPQFDEQVTKIVQTEVAGVSELSPLVIPRWREVRIQGTSYQIRSVLGVSEQYVGLMGLEMIIGAPFTLEDMNSASKKAIVTLSLADQLFGSADQAIGRTLQPPAMGRPPGGNDQSAAGNRVEPPVQTFTITGVIEDPTEVQRKAYGVADVLIPYTAAFPIPMNSAFARSMLLGTQVIKVEGASISTVEAQLQEVLGRAYGEDLNLLVWEGTPTGETVWLEETRQTIATFNLVVNLLGFVLLITGAIGILSIMLVEVLGRSRQIALERAFGASRRTIVAEFFARSAALSLLSAAIGLVLSLVFAGPLQKLLQPVLAGVGLNGQNGALITPLSVLIAFAAAVLIGGTFGIFPVFSALQTPIAAAIREV